MTTLSALLSMKSQQPLTCLTVYDASFARILAECGTDVLLVGDSLGMVVQGHNSTVPVTLDDMIYHAQLVRRGAPNAFIMVDLPFMTCHSIDAGMTSAQRIMQETSANMVKIEGGDPMLPLIGQLTEQGIPVCGHLGLLPQKALRLGYKRTGKTPSSAEELLRQAIALADAGISLLVLECVEPEVAQNITQQLPIPTIGIGSGAGTDGQVLVLHDVLGLSQRSPAFAPSFMTEGRDIRSAIQHYLSSVKTRQFP
jgi:3-methyl-2-oxobutanoate hydroxymethyltransferase